MLKDTSSAVIVRVCVVLSVLHNRVVVSGEPGRTGVKGHIPCCHGCVCVLCFQFSATELWCLMNQAEQVLKDTSPAVMVFACVLCFQFSATVLC